MKYKNIHFFANLMVNKAPYAKAELSGAPVRPELNGSVSFYPAHRGTLVVAEVYGLPQEAPGTETSAPINPFGFHIHQGGTCGSGSDSFLQAGGHFDPEGKPHPMHAGDMPVLLSNNGYAFMAFYTHRFTPDEVVGRTVIIHENPDDYRSQPAGNSGKRIACGIVTKLSG